MRTRARQVRFDFGALLAFKHAESELFVKRRELFAIHHERASSRDSRRRSRPPRIQLFTVPSGWPVAAEISLCVMPSKNASSMARRCASGREFISVRTFAARLDWS